MVCFCRVCFTHGMLTPVAPRRHLAGFDTCLRCGEADARKVKHTIVPMPKSNYIVVTDRTLLRGLNSSHKGGR